MDHVTAVDALAPGDRRRQVVVDAVARDRAKPVERARGRMKDGRRFGRPPAPFQPPAARHYEYD